MEPEHPAGPSDRLQRLGEANQTAAVRLWVDLPGSIEEEEEEKVKYFNQLWAKIILENTK